MTACPICGYPSPCGRCSRQDELEQLLSDAAWEQRRCSWIYFAGDKCHGRTVGMSRYCQVHCQKGSVPVR